MNAARIVDVAVGVLIRDDGDFLLAQRPAGKPYAGYWEFPGGKLEPGESVAQALHRELHEELGLDIGTVCPWVVREHVYPHAHVRLHFCRVFDWCGDAHGREGQAFGFFSLRRLPAGPLLEGALPVMPWLALPERCRLLSGGRATTVAGPAERPGRSSARPAARRRASAWWAEVAAARPRRGCQVRDRVEAEAAAISRGRFPRRRGGRALAVAGRLGDSRSSSSRRRQRRSRRCERVAAHGRALATVVLAASVPALPDSSSSSSGEPEHVTLVGPGAEVDQTAALAAERPERKGVAPLDVGAARRALDDVCHGRFGLRTRRARGRRERRAPAGAA